MCKNPSVEKNKKKKTEKMIKILKCHLKFFFYFSLNKKEMNDMRFANYFTVEKFKNIFY